MALIDRARSMLFQPRATWRVVDAEFTKPGALWGRYILPLAAIGPVATTISWIVFGKPVPLTSLSNRVPISSAVTRGVAEFVLALVSVVVLTKILSALAPGFGGQRNDVQALKGTAYAYTAAWLGGVFALIPVLWPLKWLFYLYTFYLMYSGIAIVMKVPASQSAAYGAVATIATVVVFLLMVAVLSVF
ncbi:MAG: YIP1 family protein [Gemmatimonadales bacterium]